MSTHESGYLKGFRRWRGSILATKRNPDLHASCSIPKHSGISDRSEQNSSKIRNTFATSLEVVRLFKGWLLDVFRSRSELKGKERILSFEEGSPRSHYVDSSLWERLWTCRRKRLLSEWMSRTNGRNDKHSLKCNWNTWKEETIWRMWAYT